MYTDTLLNNLCLLVGGVAGGFGTNPFPQPFEANRCKFCVCAREKLRRKVLNCWCLFFRLEEVEAITIPPGIFCLTNEVELGAILGNMTGMTGTYVRTNVRTYVRTQRM